MFIQAFDQTSRDVATEWISIYRIKVWAALQLGFICIWYCLSLPRIQKRYARTNKVRAIPRNYRQVVLKCSRC